MISEGVRATAEIQPAHADVVIEEASGKPTLARRDHDLPQSAEVALRTLAPSSGNVLDQYKDLIRRLYVEDERPLDDVIRIIQAQEKEVLSRNMFKKKIRIWKMYKVAGRSRPLHPPATSASRVQRQVLPQNSSSTRRTGVHRSEVKRFLPDPIEIKIPQEMYSAVQAFVSSRLQPRLHYIFAEQGCRGFFVQRRDLMSPESFLEFDAAFLNGIQAVTAGKAATWGAFFEKGFRLIDDVILSHHFSVVIKILKVIFEAQLAGIPEIGRMLVQQFHRTAYALLGPEHPHVKWSRGLLTLYDRPGVFQSVMEAISQVMQDVLGVEDNYSLTMRDAVLKYSYTSSDTIPSPGETIAKFEVLLEDCRKSTFVSNYPLMSVQDSFAHFLISSGEFARAESILANTPLQLSENRDKPIRRNTLLSSVCLLADSRAAQGKDELAERTFSFAISNAVEIFGAEHDETLKAYQLFANFLATRGREDEVRSLRAMIDTTLEPYMLRPESIGSSMAIAAAQQRVSTAKYDKSRVEA